MEGKTEVSQTSASAEISFVLGGPFYRIQRALRLIHPDRWNVGRRIALLLVIGGLPLVVLTAVLNPDALVSLLRDYRIHSRLLVAVPALVLGDLLMESRFRLVMAHIREAGLLDSKDLIYMNGVIAKLIRIRDSIFPEALVLLLLVLHTATSYKGLVDSTPWLTRGTGAGLHLTAAGWYAVLVTAPIFQFLLGLGLWKWLLWTFFAFKLSQRHLKLVPTHPDEHGGLGFLGLTASAFAPAAFAATAVIGATWRQEILHDGAHLVNFKLPAIALLLITALVALGPLVFFIPRLSALRRRGILEYGLLGQLHSTEYHEKWILNRTGHEEEFLRTPETTTLANFGNVYEKIESLKAFPADLGALYTLAAAVMIPALPAILAEIPLMVVLQDLFKALR
jgi:hypothetical protein